MQMGHVGSHYQTAMPVQAIEVHGHDDLGCPLISYDAQGVGHLDRPYSNGVDMTHNLWSQTHCRDPLNHRIELDADDVADFGVWHRKLHDGLLRARRCCAP